MSAGSSTRWAGLAALLCTACAGAAAPKGWLPEPRNVPMSAHGGWLHLWYSEGAEHRQSAGELIAVSADSVWILNDTAGLVIPTTAADSGRLWVYQPRSGDLGRWALLGTLSTISHGVVLLFTAPMWVIAGGFAVSGEVGAAQRRAPPLTWGELSAYARFPQGLPESVALNALRAKTAPLKRP
jgi:hypothetical protein